MVNYEGTQHTGIVDWDNCEQNAEGMILECSSCTVLFSCESGLG